MIGERILLENQEVIMWSEIPHGGNAFHYFSMYIWWRLMRNKIEQVSRKGIVDSICRLFPDKFKLRKRTWTSNKRIKGTWIIK